MPMQCSRPMVRSVVVFGLALTAWLASFVEFMKFSAHPKLPKGYFSIRSNSYNGSNDTTTNITISTNSSSTLMVLAAEASPIVWGLPPELRRLIHDWQNADDDTKNHRLLYSAASVLALLVSDASFVQHRPNSGLVFVKTHKTGSSTVASLCHSLGTSHRLRVPVTNDKGKTWLHGSTRQQDAQTMRHLPSAVFDNNDNDDHVNVDASNRTFDVWCNHVRFDPVLWKVVDTDKQPQLVSIVRDPATRIQSACRYYGCCPAKSQKRFDNFVLKTDCQEYFSIPKKKHLCELDQSSREIVGSGGWVALTGNSSTATAPSFDDEFEALLVNAERGNVLLLVVERMTESMLALQHQYQLHPLDVTFLSKKVSKKKQAASIINRTAQVQDLMRHRYNPFDTRLHQAANRLLDQRIRDIFGNNSAIAAQAVEQLDTLNDIVALACQYQSQHSEETNTTVPTTSKDVWTALAEWCDEKELDNTAWNAKHMKRVKERPIKNKGAGRTDV